ncbi:MAG: type IV pilin [Hadesarchaea archaeon]|nr:type IV pilin [Hadesarchaea archaeon]
MRRIKREARGISPIIATILLIAVTAVAGGIIAAYVAGLYVPRGGLTCTADASGTIMDKDTGTADNYINGKVIIDVKVMSDDIDDVLDATNPLIITVVGRGKVWKTPAMNLKDEMTAQGKTEANYGETFTFAKRFEPTVTGATTDNLYVKVSVPTTAGGEVDEGMSIRIEMNPCGVDNTLQDPATTDWWDRRDTIDIYISARADALTLTGYDGAYLTGTEIDR